jgi:ferric-dicitrate binding protein FerR (iron transport regulator)
MSGKEDLNEFIRAVSDGNPAKEAAGARVLAAFEAAGKPPLGAKERVLASLPGRPVRSGARRLVPAFGLAAAVAAFLLLRPAPGPEPLLSTDWRSYDNFPYYSNEARMYLNPIDPEARSLDGLIPSAEYGF